MKLKQLAFFFLLVLIFSCENGTDVIVFEENPELQTVAAKVMIANNNDFAIDFFKTVVQNEDKPNYMVSPISLSLALGMVHNGVAGETKNAFDITLGSGYNLSEVNAFNQTLMTSLIANSSGVSFGLVNGIWAQNDFPIETAFININKEFYKSEVANVDFQDPSTVTKINNWSSNNTNGRIDKLIEEFDSGTVLFLANATYFKSDWQNKFDKDKTQLAPFFTSLETGKEVSMMNMQAKVLNFRSELFSAIVLPYKEKRFEMVVLLPNENRTTSEVVENLSSEVWETIFTEGRFADISISLPRFKSSYQNGLNDELRDLGLGIMFTNEADLSKINKDAQLRVSRVFQKTFIEVNEQGTEAAAVTGIEIINTSVSPAFVANRPFVYVIRERFTGTICFIGRLGNP
ncbi:MAG: serpin family protein [Cellulophaga sp.]|nr:serpin family protein [Cellulophaga sp.]